MSALDPRSPIPGILPHAGILISNPSRAAIVFGKTAWASFSISRIASSLFPGLW